ncbi:MAG: beta-N-acetylglucosaminidase domain-containing protein [Deltaproteobacteria bacterium]|nr:beta-N-acetylglucosaminidase domain-containing protein [Deltaproteobacteria bacterium]
MLFRSGALILLLASCRAPSALESLADEELCAPGSVDASAILLPRPRYLGRLSAPAPLSSPEISLSGSLSLPSFPMLVKASGLEIGRRGLLLEALGPESFDAVSDRCKVTIPDSPEAYFLATVDRPEGPVAVIVGSERAGARATSLLAAILSDGFREAFVVDAPTQPIRGILEGFYGPPWSPEERLEMIELAWRTRMNTYVWAPKNVLASRLLWRLGYGDEELASLASMANLGDQLGVEICALLSPGIGVAYSSAEDRAIALEKLELFASLGARCVGLAFDDIDRSLREEDDAWYSGSLAQAQVELVNDIAGRFWASHPGARFGFVPTDYSSRAMESHPEYVEAIEAALSDEIFVGWTGPEIAAEAISATDLTRAAEALGRSPVVGDNYPVVDGDREHGAIQLGAVRRRDAQAVREAGGWVSNGMPLPLASQLALATVAELTWDPASYEPDAAAGRSREFLAPAHAAELELLTDASAPGLFHDGSGLERQVNEYLATYPEPHAELTSTLSRWTALPARLAPSGRLGEELRPWTKQLASYGQLALQLLELTHGDTPAAELLAPLKREAAELEASGVRVTEQAPRLVRELLRRLAPS